MRFLNSSAKKVIIVLLSLMLAPLPPCLAAPDREAKKAYESGDFDQAARILVEKLRKKSDHQDNIILLETVLPFAFKKGISIAKDYESKGEWDKAVVAYNNVKTLADEVSYMPPVMKETKIDGKKQKQPISFQVVDVTNELNSARQSAIRTHYDDGMAKLQANQWKGAAVEFRLVKQYDPNYQDASARYDECRKKAIFKIAIMPFDDVSGKTQYGNLGPLITERVISTAFNSNPEFLEFVTREYLQQLFAEQGIQQTTAIDPGTATALGRKIGVQAFVFGKILSVISNYPGDIVKTGTNTAEFYVGKGQTRTAYVAYEMGTRSGEVKIQASYQIVDVVKGTIISAETIEETANRTAQWVKFKGDEDAIPHDVKKHHTTGDVPIDSPEVLANEAATKLAGVLAGRLVSKFE